MTSKNNWDVTGSKELLAMVPHIMNRVATFLQNPDNTENNMMMGEQMEAYQDQWIKDRKKTYND